MFFLCEVCELIFVPSEIYEVMNAIDRWLRGMFLKTVAELRSVRSHVVNLDIHTNWGNQLVPAYE